jgi:hypothetical protein
MTVDDVVPALGDSGTGISDISQRVRVTLNRLTRAHGLVAKDGKRQGAKWSLMAPARNSA